MEQLFNYNLDNLSSYLNTIGEKPYKAKQIFKWLYQKNILDFNLMLDLSKTLRANLMANFTLNILEAVKVLKDQDGTQKFLFKLSDNNLIETVLIKHSYGNSVCITTELGCNMGCIFCASGLYKKKRNLNLGELILQLVSIKKITNEEINSVVIMGTGEPFTNYDNVVEFIKLINANYSFNIGARKITVSTCGIVAKIKEFAHLDLQVNLAISLHASNDKLRDMIMPINKTYPIKELLNALDYYYSITKRRITIEYIMLKGLNSGLDNARELAMLLKNRNVYVNLIPYNEVNELPLKRADKHEIDLFFKELKKARIDTTIRISKGLNATAACGQLRVAQLK